MKLTFVTSLRRSWTDQTSSLLVKLTRTPRPNFSVRRRGLLFPIDWPEPFGLVMIEATACGTPVLAFRCGSVPEIVEDRLTGRIVSTVDEAVHAVPELLALDRKAIRSRFEERFSSRRMASDYVKIYETILRKPRAPQIQLSALETRSARTRARGFEAPPAVVRRDRLKQPFKLPGENLQKGSASASNQNGVRNEP
jgi:hypothetical protein